jgi:hypothetical protein
MDNRKIERVADGLERLYSEEQAREILHKSYEALHWGMERVTRFSFVHLSPELIQMTDQELSYWDSILNLKEIVRQDVERFQLVVADLRDIQEDTIFQEDEQINTKFSFAAKSQFAVLPPFPRHYKHYTMLHPFNPEVDGLNFYIRPRFKLSSLRMKRSLFMPNLSIEIFVTDKSGRLVVRNNSNNFKVKDLEQDFSGKSAEDMRELYGIYGPPAFSAHQPTIGVIWFNTTIDPNKKNEVYSKSMDRSAIILSGELHNKENIDLMEIPEDIKTKLFFWQISQFLERDQFQLKAPQPKLLDEN